MPLKSVMQNLEKQLSLKQFESFLNFSSLDKRIKLKDISMQI